MKFFAWPEVPVLYSQIEQIQPDNIHTLLLDFGHSGASLMLRAFQWENYENLNILHGNRRAGANCGEMSAPPDRGGGCLNY